LEQRIRIFSPKKIACPTDFSDGSLEAISAAREIALKAQSELLLINVLPIQSELSTDPAFGVEQTLRDQIVIELEKLARQLGAKNVRTRAFVGYGDAASEIVRIANEEEADLLIIATYGKTGLRRFALGSVAEKVIRLASCPVLVVRGTNQSALSGAA